MVSPLVVSGSLSEPTAPGGVRIAEGLLSDCRAERGTVFPRLQWASLRSWDYPPGEMIVAEQKSGDRLFVFTLHINGATATLQSRT